MNLNARFYKAGLCALAVVFFCGVWQTQKWMNQDREKLGFTKMETLQNAPPVLAFTTVALGSFRGLIANALWMRASDLQEQDKFFEMVQLSEWITKLEPHFVAVWQVQAWNMAYNISVKFKNPEDRWQWVQRGIRLLRDEGLKYNPHETALYRDLSWLFQHKVGQNLDDAHMTYKLRWAQQMEPFFPTGHPVAITNPPTAQWRARAKELEDTYKMDPQLIATIDHEYGPLDWRLPDAHAVYWAELGRIHGSEKDQETLRRSIYQTLQQACIRGGGLPRTVTNITANNFFLRPNLDLIPVVNAAYEKLVAEQTDPAQIFSSKNAHKNFLKQVIPLLYADNRMEDAKFWFKYVNRVYSNAFAGPDAGITLDQFVLNDINENIGSTDMNKVMDLLIGFIHTEHVCLILDEPDKVLSYEALEKKIADHYNDAIKGASDQRLHLPPLAQVRQSVLQEELNPDSAFLPPQYHFSEENKAILRSKMGLPANWPAGQTNSPPTQ